MYQQFAQSTFYHNVFFNCIVDNYYNKGSMEKMQIVSNSTSNKHPTILLYQKQLEKEVSRLLTSIKQSEQPQGQMQQYKEQHKQQQKEERRQQKMEGGEIKIKQQTRVNLIRVLKLQKKLQIINEMITSEQDKQKILSNSENTQYQELIEGKFKDTEYEPTEQQINGRLENINEANWTDATQSVNSDDEQIWVVDDEIVQAMEEDSEEDQWDEQSDDQEKQEITEKMQQVNLQDLQTQFLKGGQSDHLLLLGQHSKFCVSVKGNKDILLSGGGDDQLFFYKLTQIIDQEGNLLIKDPSALIKPYHIVKHNETVNNIHISFDQQHVFSLSDKQLFCTSLENMNSTRVRIDDKEEEEQISVVCCHQQGNVFAISKGYEAYIYNVKGLKHFSTFYLDAEINFLQFTRNGKQLLAACQNKLRIINPKTQQIVKVGGALAHTSEITCMATDSNLALTGCIDGFVCLTNINNGSIVGRTQRNDSSINCIKFASNYFLCGTSEEAISWYDVNKLKKLFQNDVNGSPTCILQMDDGLNYSIGTLKGYIYNYDRRNPLKCEGILKTGSSIHELWAHKNIIFSACEDGYVKLYDRRQLK